MAALQNMCCVRRRRVVHCGWCGEWKAKERKLVEGGKKEGGARPEGRISVWGSAGNKWESRPKKGRKRFIPLGDLRCVTGWSCERTAKLCSAVATVAASLRARPHLCTKRRGQGLSLLSSSVVSACYHRDRSPELLSANSPRVNCDRVVLRDHCDAPTTSRPARFLRAVSQAAAGGVRKA